MRQHLLDTGVLLGYLKGRTGAVALVGPWVLHDEAATSVVAYGEASEYFKGFPDYVRHRSALRALLRLAPPYPLTYSILERYANLRRSLRPPYGPGLIGDIDTLIAATAIEHGLILVTTDGDFARVPRLRVTLLSREALRG